MIEFTPELIAGIVGMVTSWIFSWFPSLRTWYAALKTEIKSFVMLGLLAIASVVIYFLALYGIIETSEPITVIKLITIFFMATTINQVSYSITPQAQDVRDIQTNKIITEIKIVKEE
jgi:hypothetical protein